MYENSTKKLGLRTAGMAGALGVILFAYICLVFLVTHRICMMQCNPMSRPGKSRQNGRLKAVLLFVPRDCSPGSIVATAELYKFMTSLYLEFVVSNSNSCILNICRCIPR